MNVAKTVKKNRNLPIRATIRRNQAVRGLRRKFVGPMAQIAIAGLVIALLLLVYVTEKNVVMSYSYQLDELEQQREDLRAYRDRLELALLQLQSLERVDRVARAELGMVEPRNVRYVAMAGPVESEVQSAPERVVAQVAEYINGLFVSVAKAAGLYEGR